MFTREHFEVIARVLRESHDILEPAAHELMLERFACALGTTNPRFKRERFLRAAAGMRNAGRAAAVMGMKKTPQKILCPFPLDAATPLQTAFSNTNSGSGRGRVAEEDAGEN